MADDSLQKTLAHLQSAARAAGKSIDPKPLTDEQREAALAALASRSRQQQATIQQHGQVAVPAAPSAAPPAQPPTLPDDGMAYLVDTWPHRAAIKASRQAGYSAERRRWYLLDPTRYDRIPPQCLPPGLPVPAGAGGGSPQEPTADQAPARPVPPSSDAPQSPRSDDLRQGATVVVAAPPGTNPLLARARMERYYLDDGAKPQAEQLMKTGVAAMDPSVMRLFVTPWSYDKPDMLEQLRPWLGPDVLAWLDGLARAAVSPTDETPVPAPMASASLPETPQAPVLQSPVLQPPQSATILALPWWPTGDRAVPNPIVRSALFGVVRRGRRAYLRGIQLPAIGGTDIRYTGEQLDQADLDVWMGILELFKGQDIAMRRGRAVVGIREFLRSIGRTYSSGSRDWLNRTLARLSATNVEISADGQTYGGSLLVEYARDERTSQLVVEINPRLVRLFQAHEWTRINWDERQALGGSEQLAKWLHGFYSSHQAPYAITIKALQEWSGSTAGTLYEFRSELREAMGRVAAATGWHWELDREDRLHVIRPKMLPGGDGT